MRYLSRSPALVVLAAALSACASSPPAGGGSSSQGLQVVDDFSAGISRWKDKSSGRIRVDMQVVDGFGRFTIAGRPEEGSWSDLMLLLDEWPATAAAISFRARAERPCTILAKLVEGHSHNEMEQFGVRIELGTRWREYRLRPAQFTLSIWSSTHEPGLTNGKLDAEKISGFGFVETDLPVTFDVDDVRFE